jgi:hypothetical protein
MASDLVSATRDSLRATLQLYPAAAWRPVVQAAIDAVEVRVEPWKDPLRLGCTGPPSAELLALLPREAGTNADAAFDAVLRAVRSLLGCSSLPWKQPKDLSDD